MHLALLGPEIIQILLLPLGDCRTASASWVYYQPHMNRGLGREETGEEGLKDGVRRRTRVVSGPNLKTRYWGLSKASFCLLSELLAWLGLACQTVIPNPLVCFGVAMGSAEPTSGRFHKAYVPLSAVPCMSCLHAEVALNFTP